MSRYLIIIESTGTGFSAYSPDLPGCVATGQTRAEVEEEMHDAIKFHIEGLRLSGEPVPAPPVRRGILRGGELTRPPQRPANGTSRLYSWVSGPPPLSFCVQPIDAA